MSSDTESPKLYPNKPKKAHIKQAVQQSSRSSMGTTTQASKIPPPVTPPPLPQKESFARRYKFLWPLLLTVNLAVGAYLFMRTKKQDGVVEEGAEPNTSAAATAAASVSETPVLPPTYVTQPVKVREPIPEDQQRELFKWLLEEKRKVKTKDPEEKKRIDEEKALLKQFIRAKSIPSL